MSWQLLPTDYKDAAWSGLKKYNPINNEDGTLSLQDVTQYSNLEKSFFGAIQANKMNEALNTIMSMLEQGTDLYEAFQIYFDTQKQLFEESEDVLKGEYRTEIDTFESLQEQLFNLWFSNIKGKLSEDAAGKLQNEIDALDMKVDGFVSKTTTFSSDGKTCTEVGANETKRVTTFNTDGSITEKLYVGVLLIHTKVTSFSSDGKQITEEVQ